MSGLELMRPATRSVAVRPHSAFPSPAVEQSPAPRPASAASRCSASLFFAPAPRPFGRQSYWQAGHCSHLGWEHGRGWERFREQEYRLFSRACAIVPTVPSFSPARVIHVRARACAALPSSLGTWEQSQFLVQYQGLEQFPRLFPSRIAVGTREHWRSAARLSDRLRGRSNKIEVGNADLQRASGDARRKFRAPIAAGELELGRIRQLPTRRGGNGGFAPFFARLGGHVGRVMLEGCRQAADRASFSALRLKLGRLRDHPRGELTLRLAIEGPGAPNRAPSSPAMPALHGGRIWIETSIGAVQGGSKLDRSTPTFGRTAQTGSRQWGPGGARSSNASEFAGRRHNRRAGKRAGVRTSPAWSRRPHDAGECQTLRPIFADVNTASNCAQIGLRKGIANG